MNRAEVLDAVKKTICQDRNDIHGEPENSFPLIAQRWTQYLHAAGLLKNGARLHDYHAAELLAEFKQVRHQIQPAHADNQHDQIGYLAIAAELRAGWEAKPGAAAPFENAPNRVIPYGEPIPSFPAYKGEVIMKIQHNGKGLTYRHVEPFGWVNTVDAAEIAAHSIRPE